MNTSNYGGRPDVEVPVMHGVIRRCAAPSVLFLTLLVACDSGPRNVAATNAPPDINDFFEEVFERRLAHSPIRQSQLGRKTGQLDRWDDFSDAFAERRIEAMKADLAKLRRDFVRAELGPDEQLSFDLFEFNSETAVRNFEFHRHRYVVDQFNGQLSGLITVLQNNHAIENEADAQDYISRIEGLEGVLNELAAQLADRADFGVIAPAFSFADVIADATNMSSGAPIEDVPHDNAVFEDFTNKVNALALPAATREELILRASAALRGGYARGFGTLLGELARVRDLADSDRGVWSLPDGERYYRNRIRHHTTLELSAEEIHETGLREVERLQDEMREIMAAVGFDGSLREFFDEIRSAPDNYYDNSDAGRAEFLVDAREQIREIYDVVGEYFNELPRADIEVRRVEPWRENSTSIAFYNRPSEDGVRPGIYYANLADMTSVQKYVFTAITYHESVPGHHFQIALAQEMRGLPSFRKYNGYGAFTEGWALYAEQLAKEMGFYENPYHDFGRLQNELWRSIRLVLDTGIHARRWSRQRSIDYFRENSPLSEGDIVTEVERFFVNPGQALGYKIGMMKILELRSRARDALGEAFDIREFHDAVIGAGSLPLSLLERRVVDYVNAEQPKN